MSMETLYHAATLAIHDADCPDGAGCKAWHRNMWGLTFLSRGRRSMELETYLRYRSFAVVAVDAALTALDEQPGCGRHEAAS